MAKASKDSNTRAKRIFPAPVAVNVERFLQRLQVMYGLDVTFTVRRSRRPIRMLGRATDDIELIVWGPDSTIFLSAIDAYLDDFLEANGFFA